VTTERDRPRDPRPVIDRFVAACSADERIVAAFLGGSRARGDADRYSDLDLCVIATDEAHDDVVAGRATLVQRLGEPLFLEDFGLDAMAFFILADGTEGEIFFGRRSRLDVIHVGPFEVLLDKGGVLMGAEFPIAEPDPTEQAEALHRVLYWFWHDLSHFIAGMGRGQLWWAHGQLEALRGLCVNLARIERGAEAGEEPYEKIDTTIPATALSPLTGTFVPLERRAMLEAAIEIVRFFQERAPRVAETHGETYPVELERLMVSRLDDLVASFGNYS